MNNNEERKSEETLTKLFATIPCKLKEQTLGISILLVMLICTIVFFSHSLLIHFVIEEKEDNKAVGVRYEPLAKNVYTKVPVYKSDLISGQFIPGIDVDDPPVGQTQNIFIYE